MHLETLGFRDITLDTFNRDKEPVAGTLESVRSAGRLLRGVHDATGGWVPPADANWAVPFSPATSPWQGCSRVWLGMPIKRQAWC